ncbi:RNA-directed DNA polymerase, partial [Streptococcus macedonicus]
LDISNFYGSIYTHSLHWAIIGEENAKEEHNSFGSGIDKRFQWMNYRETVGIPQGNVVSDFFAELLLAYIDVKLVNELEISKISGYHILRYRDDYRIFTNSIDELHKIKKILSVILQRYKLSLGDSKTKLSDNVVKDSIKEDKLYWLKHDPVVKLSGDKFYKKPEEFFSDFLSYVGFTKKKNLSKKRFKNYFDNRIYSATVQKAPVHCQRFC